MPALIAAASTAILNSLGRIAAFLFSWAMVGFFGKMPPKRQYLLAGIGLMSMLWLIFVIGTVKPEVVQFLFLLNKGLQNPRVESIVEKFSLGFVGALPFLIGLASLFVDAEPPKTWGGKAQQVLKGWIIAPGFAIAMLLMMVTASITLAVTHLKRLKTEHVPIKLQEGGYEAVLRDLRDALNKNGVPVREQELPWYLKPPVLVMSLLAKSIVQGLVTPGARMLSGDNGVNVVLHPTDLIITGPKTTAMHARAVITQRVPFTQAYLTWEEAAQKFEDRITALWREWRATPASGPGDIVARLRKIEEMKADLHKEDLPFEQWEVVYRELLQLQDEIVSGRLQTGQTPVAADAAGAPKPLGNGQSPLLAGAPANGSPTGGSSTNGSRAPSSASRLPLDELAIAGAILAAYWWWTQRRVSDE